VHRLVSLKPQLILLEASGGFETLAATALRQADLPAQIISPRQVREFARSTDKLAKTDQIGVRFWPILLGCCDRRAPLAGGPKAGVICPDDPVPPTGLAWALLSRLRSAKAFQVHLHSLQKQLQELQQDLDDLIHRSPVYVEKDQLLQSVLAWVL
jgi:transposase